ncbi:hypothetical protein CC85DRAFT_283987 [Cutaneotrichosporon oleaginosum]|uniref:Uncharacterized protein n=1 Tax=Cutaneotrichosporon oleaginosum TaxID=879819 RepID=A0A0J0XS98_9TREE|nr:uncharacterized protein CC85DRAFT_283987 [Cutaneotrichosporon oleaginosum]KLT43945.1 hypothetical protein CC85DRAFT_283987 [Cutaneotrichosporon oleaginosum]TXT04108.1 hypothetical protein COLE_07805 [Cutaneotrichosporon oleaginosum]
MCFGRRPKEPKQMQSVAKALYKPSTHPPVPVMEDYTPSAKSSTTRLAAPRMSAAHRNSIASVGGDTVSSGRTSVAEAEREAEQAALRALVTQRKQESPDSPFVFPALAPWIEAGQLAALLQQDALVEAGDELGEHRFDVDMAAGTLTFTSDDGRKLECGAHLLCSIAPGPRSILWGWAHPRGDDVAAGLRRAGDELKLPELAAEELPFPEGFEPTEDDVAALAHEIGAAAVGILRRGPYYSAPNGTARVLFILDAPLPQLTLATAVAKAPRILASGLINNPRRAVEGLAGMMGWSSSAVADGRGLQFGDGKSAATVMFDENGRWAGISAALAAGASTTAPTSQAAHNQAAPPTVTITAAA